MHDSDHGGGAALEARVRSLIAATFRVEEADLPADLRMGSIPSWDSMGHMELILELERAFGVTFPTYAVAELVSIPDIVRMLESEGSR